MVSHFGAKITCTCRLACLQHADEEIGIIAHCCQSARSRRWDGGITTDHEIGKHAYGSSLRAAAADLQCILGTQVLERGSQEQCLIQISAREGHVFNLSYQSEFAIGNKAEGVCCDSERI
jgi:hypothetical protein